MKHFRSALAISLIGLLLVVGNAGAGHTKTKKSSYTRSNIQRLDFDASKSSPQTEDALDAEARKQVEKFASYYFIKCGSVSWYSIRSFGYTDYNVVEVKGFRYTVSSGYPRSEADKENGVEWRGRGTFEASVIRKLFPERSELAGDNSDWQDWENAGTIAEFPIEKRNGKWKIDDRDNPYERSESSELTNLCAPTCDLLQRPDKLKPVINERFREYLAWQRNNASQPMLRPPFPLCSSFYAFFKEVDNTRNKAETGLASNEHMPEDQFLKEAQQMADRYFTSNYIKCNDKYYAFWSQGEYMDIEVYRFDNLSYQIKPYPWKTEADFSSSSSGTGALRTYRVVEVIRNGSKPSKPRRVNGSRFPLDHGYYGGNILDPSFRLRPVVSLVYTWDKNGGKWSGPGLDIEKPPSCANVIKAWEVLSKEYQW